jgi:Flp pilus assembly pilin Flp
MGWLARFQASEDGGGMVEFAIVGTLLSVLLMGVFEFGAAAWAKNNVAADAREGARYAIVHGTRSGAATDQAGVQTYLRARSQLGNAIRVYAWWPDGKDPEKQVIVSVAYTVPRRGPFIPSHRDSSTSKMYIVY